MFRFREPTSGFTHLFAALLSVLWAGWLIYLTRHDTWLMMTMLVYGFGMIFVFMASAVYHLVNGSPKVIDALLRFDFVGIYLMIAGTYTPLAFFFLEGAWRWALLLGVWTPTLAGIIYALVYWRRRQDGKHPMLYFYIAVGGVGVVGSPYFITILPSGALILILLGGMSYLIGSVVFALDKPNLHRYFNAHDLWHIFVILGNGFFFVTILQYVALGR